MTGKGESRRWDGVRHVPVTSAATTLAEEEHLGEHRMSVRINRSGDRKIWRVTLPVAVAIGALLLVDLRQNLLPDLLGWILAGITVAMVINMVGPLWRGGAAIHLFTGGAVVERYRGSTASFRYQTVTPRYVLWEKVDDLGTLKRRSRQLWLKLPETGYAVHLDGTKGKDAATLDMLLDEFGVTGEPEELGALKAPGPMPF